MQRLGIFLLYDKQGVVDDYIVYLLEKMRCIYQQLVIVCNCVLDNKSMVRLTEFSNEIIQRDNIGYDAGGFKDALCNHIGWERIGKFDELLLFNDSCFGPFFSMERIFSKMNEKSYDFWCMTKNTGNIHMGTALQSYFIVIRRRMLNSSDFREYWENMPYYTTFKDVVVEYEMKFADYFAKKGYSWDAYVDTQKYDVPGNRKYRMSLYHTVPNEIVYEQGYPFLKRKLFDLDSFGTDYGLDKQTKENFIDAIRYIDKYLDYDVDLIWKNVLRTYSLRNIQDCCCLRELICDHDNQYIERNIKIFMWLHNQYDVLDNIGKFIDDNRVTNIFIGTDSDQLCKELSEKYRIDHCGIYKNSNDFWVSIFAEFHTINSGEIVCFFNDYICISDENESYATKKSFIWNRWENLLKSKGCIDDICTKFEVQKRLGMIIPPKPMHGRYISNEYSKNIEEEIVNAFDVSDFVKRSRFAADYSESFWIRGDIIDNKNSMIMSTLLKKGFSFTDIAHVLPYVCQKALFYTAIGETTEYFKIYSQMQDVYLRFFIDRTYREGNTIPFGMLDKFLNLKEIYMEKIKEFCEKFDRVYIYGCGEIAEMVVNLMVIKNICGIIVSDNMNANLLFKGFSVQRLSECSFDEHDCVVVALNDKNSEQVRANLLKMINQERVLFLKSGGRY